MQWSSMTSHGNSNKIKSKFEPISLTIYHGMDDTMTLKWDMKEWPKMG